MIWWEKRPRESEDHDALGIFTHGVQAAAVFQLAIDGRQHPGPDRRFLGTAFESGSAIATVVALAAMAVSMARRVSSVMAILRCGLISAVQSADGVRLHAGRAPQSLGRDLPGHQQRERKQAKEIVHGRLRSASGANRPRVHRMARTSERCNESVPKDRRKTPDPSDRMPRRRTRDAYRLPLRHCISMVLPLTFRAARCATGTRKFPCAQRPLMRCDISPRIKAVLISKDEFIKAVWPDVFVTDDLLVQCVMDIRQALGDDAHRIVKTVPRRGYIFATAVSTDRCRGTRATGAIHRGRQRCGRRWACTQHLGCAMAKACSGFR